MPGLGLDTLTVTISTQASAYYTLPTCLATVAPNVVNVTLSNMVIQDWSAFPDTLLFFTCTNCIFLPLSPTSSGYESGSNRIDWLSLWSFFPNIQRILIAASGIPNLPVSLTPSINYFSVIDNGDSEGLELSPNLFDGFERLTAIDTLTLILPNIGLSGSIPPGIFLGLSNAEISSVNIDWSGNRLSGSIDPAIGQTFSRFNCTSFALNLQVNRLTGTIPADLFPPGLMKDGASAKSFFVNFGHNRLSGPIPESLFAGLSNITTFNFNAVSNDLIGPLPNAMFSSNTWANAAALSLHLAGNQINGSLPSSFISCSFSLTGPSSLGVANIQLYDNALTGTLPEAILRAPMASSISVKWTRVTLVLDLNQMSGIIPANLLSASESVNLGLANNSFSGQFPDIASLLDRTAVLGVLAQGNNFSGNPPTTCNGMSSVYYNFIGNQLNGTIPSSALWDCKSLFLDVRENSRLSGSIPPQLFNITFMGLLASNTRLSGPIPQNLTSVSAAVHLSNTKVDFCSPPWTVSTAIFGPTDCNLLGTNACFCPENYDRCTITCPGPEAPESSPGAPPECSAGTKPSEEFVCIGGVWTAPFVTTPILTIPSGAGTVVVGGNVTSTSIVMNGVGSSIVIRGCAANLTMVTVELTQEQLKELGSSRTLQTLLTFSNASECGRNLNGLALDTKVSQGCRKVRTEKVISSDGNTFGAYFTVNASGCNTWWIILVSVLCGVVILGLAAAVVTGVLWKQHQEKKAFAQLSGASSTKG